MLKNKSTQRYKHRQELLKRMSTAQETIVETDKENMKQNFQQRRDSLQNGKKSLATRHTTINLHIEFKRN